jgi:hypothetical protein
MDDVTIQKIAAEVVARLPYGDRYWLVVYVVVAALAGAVAALGNFVLQDQRTEPRDET